MRLSPRAKAQLDELCRFYQSKGRPEAAGAVTAAVNQATHQISAGKSLPAPRPYPELCADGEAWVHALHHWVVHTTGDDPVILAVFYDTADIPGRR